MKNKFYFLSILLVLFISCEVESQNNENPDDTSQDVTFTNHWFFDFNGTITGGEGFDLIKSSADGKIYVCGAFLHVDDNWDMKNLVRWNPETNTWEQVPGIDQHHKNFIRCVTEDTSGNLYFGGDFSSIGGQTAQKIAKFNPATNEWSALYDENYPIEDQQYGPVGGGVYATVISGDYLYIGGGYFNADNDEMRYIRRFNLSTNTWESVGTGTNGRVLSLAVDDAGNIYAGGEFTEAGNNPAYYIAKWNGASWEALDQGVDDYVFTLNYAGGKLYAGGSFKHVNASFISHGIAAWNGISWEAMQKGIDASWGSTPTVQDIAIDSDGKVYIGGFFDQNNADHSIVNHVAVYNKNKWEPLGDGLATSSSQGVIGMIADGKNVYFTGYFTKGIGDPNAKINLAIWNETK
jgi:hypothetical protein